jgi:hypothetical protein
MRTSFLLAAVAATATALAPPARADVVIGLSFNQASPITIEQVGVTNAFFSGAFGDFSNVSVTANGFALLGLPDLLNSTVQTVRSGNVDLHNQIMQIFITQTNVPASGLVSFNSLFTNNLLTNGWLADLQTWWDPGNQVFGLVNRVGQNIFQTSGGSPSTTFPGVDTGNSGLFSVTEVYTIFTNPNGTLPIATGNTNNTISLTASPVPGPIVGAGLPGLVTAAVGLFALVRRRRRTAIA